MPEKIICGLVLDYSGKKKKKKDFRPPTHGAFQQSIIGSTRFALIGFSPIRFPLAHQVSLWCGKGHDAVNM